MRRVLITEQLVSCGEERASDAGSPILMEWAENKTHIYMCIRTCIHSSRNLDAALIRSQAGGALGLSRWAALACIIYLLHLSI